MCLSVMCAYGGFRFFFYRRRVFGLDPNRMFMTLYDLVLNSVL